MDMQMQEHCMGHVLDDPNRTFSHCILMLCPNTREGNPLVVFFNLMFKSSAVKDPIVGMELLDDCTMQHSLTFNGTLCGNGVTGTERNLMTNKKFPRCMIEEESTANKMIAL